MSEEQVGTDAPAPEPQGPDADATASSPDPGDFEARLRSDPEFAVAEFKKQQSAASKSQARISKGARALELAEALGNGDLAAGSEAAIKGAMLLHQMRNDPQMRPLIERFEAGVPIDSAASSNGAPYYGTPDDEDPRDKQIRAMQGQLAALESRAGVAQFKDLLRGFSDGDIGKHLSADEKGEVISAIETTLRTWASTPEGRAKAMNLTADDIELIALKELRRTNKLFELGRREHQQRTAQLRERETDVPDRMTSRAMPKKSSTEISAVEALREAAAELGVSLKH